VVADRVEPAADRVVDELRAHGVDAAPAIVDVGTLAGAQKLMALAAKRFGRIDVLVNNVGGTIWIKPFHLYTEQQVHQELERSLLPTLWCCLAVLPIMMKQKAGSIVNIGSQSPRGIHRLPYAASKGGVLAMTKVLSLEYGAHGIRVNAVSPGGTEIGDRITARRAAEIGLANHVCPDDEVFPAALATAQKIAAGAIKEFSRREPSPDVWARLAARTEKVRKDFAAGALTNQQITYIIIALATALIVVIIVVAR